MEATKQYIVNEIDLIYRKPPEAATYPVVTDSRTAYQILLESWDMDKIEYVEQFKVLLLDRVCRVLGLYEASTGGTGSTITDVKVIMVAALRSNANSIILAHNHPSGRLKPSEPDVASTKKLVDAGKLLDIQVSDHIILTASGYFSFADDGMLWV